MGFIGLELDFVQRFTAAESWKHHFMCQFVERHLAARVFVLAAIDDDFTVSYFLVLVDGQRPFTIPIGGHKTLISFQYFSKYSWPINKQSCWSQVFSHGANKI